MLAIAYIFTSTQQPLSVEKLKILETLSSGHIQFIDFVFEIDIAQSSSLHNALFSLGISHIVVEAIAHYTIFSATSQNICQFIQANELKEYITSLPINYEDDINQILGHQTISVELANLIVQQLQEEQQTIAVAESCSGGYLCNAFTTLTGVSTVYMGGINTYSTESKISVLHIDKKIIDTHTVVSAAVARAMAQKAPTIFNAKAGMSTTGYIETSPDIPNAYAYFGINRHHNTTTHRIFLPYDRSRNKAFLSNHVLLHFYLAE